MTDQYDEKAAELYERAINHMKRDGMASACRNSISSALRDLAEKKDKEIARLQEENKELNIATSNAIGEKLIEREACAKVADNMLWGIESAKVIAAVIRGRSANWPD